MKIKEFLKRIGWYLEIIGPEGVAFLTMAVLFIGVLAISGLITAEDSEVEKQYTTYQLEEGTIIECAGRDYRGGLREIYDCKGNISGIENPKNLKRLNG